MNVRVATRPMTGIPPTGIEVRIGRDRNGAPKMAIDPHKYRAISIPISDPQMLRHLIGDLERALKHLEAA